MKILVTGAGGFVGRHLLDHLLACGDQVVAADHQPPARDDVPFFAVDITDGAATAAMMERVEADAVIHLAAIAFVPDAEVDPGRAMLVNVGGTANLLAGLRQRPATRFMLVSSAEVYGSHGGDEPLDESAPYAPVNVYAASKMLAERYAEFAIRRYGMDVIIARPFTIIGPYQRPDFALASFARQLATIAAGKAEPVLRVGNLKSARDFIDVRDVARAYRLALEHLPTGAIFNVCRGENIEVGKMLEDLVEIADLHVEIQTDAGRLRAKDISAMRGSARFLAESTGWRPEIDLHRTLADIWSYWSELVK